MSQASAWAKQFQEGLSSGPMFFFDQRGPIAGVHFDPASVYLTTAGPLLLPPAAALAFARWILDTFGEPSDVGLAPSAAAAHSPQGVSGP